MIRICGVVRTQFVKKHLLCDPGRLATSKNCIDHAG